MTRRRKFVHTGIVASGAMLLFGCMNSITDATLLLSIQPAAASASVTALPDQTELRIIYPAVASYAQLVASTENGAPAGQGLEFAFTDDQNHRVVATLLEM